MARRSTVLGAVLAGGPGARMGGGKAVVNLHGRPLISYPLEAVWRALGAVVIVAKADTTLPNLPGVTVWVEPEAVNHPLVGLRYALEMADGRPVLACAADLPFVTPEVVAELARGSRRAPAVIASAGGQVQPLLGWYSPRALAPLRAVDPESGMAMRELVDSIGAARIEVDPELLFNVNTPSDLLQATAMIDQWLREGTA